VDHENIYNKYVEEKNMGWGTSNNIWKEDNEEVCRICLYFSNEIINIIV
jgi:hypothetical protein